MKPIKRHPVFQQKWHHIKQVFPPCFCVPVCAAMAYGGAIIRALQWRRKYAPLDIGRDNFPVETAALLLHTKRSSAEGCHQAEAARRPASNRTDCAQELTHERDPCTLYARDARERFLKLHLSRRRKKKKRIQIQASTRLSCTAVTSYQERRHRRARDITECVACFVIDIVAPRCMLSRLCLRVVRARRVACAHVDGERF